jgi:hypothetical protein
MSAGEETDASFVATQPGSQMVEFETVTAKMDAAHMLCLIFIFLFLPYFE